MTQNAVARYPDPIQGTTPANVFTRRSVLKGMGVAGLAALLGPSLLTPGTALAASPRSRPRKAAVGGYVPPGPLQLQASSQLSQDYFLTTEVLIGSSDQVMPFLNPYSKTVEAIIFTNGVLNHLYRKPSQPSGWAYDIIDLQGLLTDVTDAAVAANGSEVYLLIFGDPDINNNPGGDPAFLTSLTDTTTWAAGTTVSYSDLQISADDAAGPIKGGVSPDGSMCYFYTVVDFPSSPTLLGWVATGDPNLDPLTYQQFKTISTTATVNDYLLLVDSSASTDSTWNGYALVFTSDGLLSVFNQNATVGPQPDADVFSPDPNNDLGGGGTTALLWAWTADGSTTGNPGYAVQTKYGVGFSDLNGNYNVLSAAAQGSLTSSETTVWLQDNLYTVNMLDSNGTVNTIQQISGDGTGSWGMPLPVSTQDKGFVAIYGVPSDPTQSTLFAVGADETLSALTLDATGWTQILIKQNSESLDEIDSYRVQVSVQDSNGAPAPAVSVQVGTDRLVGIWQPEGSTIVTPGATVTMTTDSRGQLTFSVPAQELDTAVLTIQALDGSGNPSGSPLQVIGDYDVRGFLQGTGTLTNLGTLTGAGMMAATDSNANLVFPALTNQPDAADQCAVGLGQIITAGIGAPPTGNQVQATLIDTSSGTPTTQQSTNPTQYPAPSGNSTGDPVKHLFDTIGHALRHAAAKLKQMVVRWADDVGKWVVDLAIEIGDELYSLANQVINDMKDAFNLVGGFFNALGADIKTAIDWLKHNVLELLNDTKTNAAIIEGWLGQLPTDAATVVKGIEIDGDTFFSEKQTAFDGAILELEQTVAGMTFGTNAQLPPPKTDTGSRSGEADLAKSITEIGKVLNDLPSTWLLDKLLKCLGEEATANKLIDAFQQPIDDLATDFKDSLSIATDFGNLIGTTAATFASRNGLTEQNMSNWFQSVQKLVDSVLTLADGIVDTVLDLIIAVLDELETVLTTYTINFDKVLGPLLTEVFEIAKIDLNMTTAHLIGLVIGFPASLIAQIRGLSSLFPASTSTSRDKGAAPSRNRRGSRKGVGDSEPSWLVGLGIAAAVTQGVWGLNDIVVDLADIDGGENFDAPAACEWIDIIAPLALIVFQWPTQSSDNEPIEPFSNGFRHTGPNDWMLIWTTLTAVVPPLFDLVVKLMPAGSGTNEPAPEGTTNPMAEYYSPIVQGVAALPNTVLGSIYCSRTGAGAAAITATVLGNLSYNFALLLTVWVQQSTDDTSVAAKTIIDAVGNIGAAIAIAQAATLPPK